jgi:hypothetical protein
MTYKLTSEPFEREVAESIRNHTAHVHTRHTSYIKLIVGRKGLDFEPRIVDSMLKLN